MNPQQLEIDEAAAQNQFVGYTNIFKRAFKRSFYPQKFFTQGKPVKKEVNVGRV